MDSKRLSHTRWKCQYHIVFIPKCQKKKLFGQLKLGVREMLSTLCRYKGVEIIEGAMCADSVHMCVSIPPKISISNFMGYLKGKSKLMIYDRHSEQQSKWNKAFLGKRVFCGDGRECNGGCRVKIHSGTVRRGAKEKVKKPLFSGSK